MFFFKKKHNPNSHGFHLVDPSPWPFFAALAALFTTFGFVMYLHGYSRGGFFCAGLCYLIYILGLWWRDVVREATFEGQHTSFVQRGIKIGFLLFILSEVMFFFAFFWAFFHSSLNPTPAIGCIWPPLGIVVLNPWHIPLLNTILLLTSGATITWAHHSIVYGDKNEACLALIHTIILAVVFTLLQLYEYKSASFNISDGIYGSTFYMITGFHGFHVIIGTCFIGVALFRLYYNHFTRTQHVGFETAAWYWHFVDIVWILVFIIVYWWGS
jgi:heme/copper-type cytochrome/quinol oxidase subunit 3